MVDKEKYQKWLKFLFDQKHEDLENKHDPLEHLEEDVPDYFIHLCQNSAQDLKEYSNRAVAIGLSYILNPCESDYSYQLKQNLSTTKIQEILLSIQYLYLNIFESYCFKKLCHTDETSEPLNQLCYILWDMCPLSYFEEYNDKDELYRVFTATLNFALSLKNPACIESALHGLGHTELYYPPASDIIQKFIDSKQCENEDLLEYAATAKEGMIQ